MPKHVQQLGHPTAQAAAFIGRDRQISVDTGLKTIRVHDGVNAGGTLLAKNNDLVTERDRVDALIVEDTSIRAALDTKAAIAGQVFTGFVEVPDLGTDENSAKVWSSQNTRSYVETIRASLQANIDALMSMDMDTPLTIADIMGLMVALDTKAPINNPNLSGDVRVPDRAAGTNNGQAANTRYVDSAVEDLAEMDKLVFSSAAGTLLNHDSANVTFAEAGAVAVDSLEGYHFIKVFWGKSSVNSNKILAQESHWIFIPVLPSMGDLPLFELNHDILGENTRRIRIWKTSNIELKISSAEVDVLLFAIIARKLAT